MRPSENSITFKDGEELRHWFEMLENPDTGEPATEFLCRGCGAGKPLAELKLAMVVDGVQAVSAWPVRGRFTIRRRPPPSFFVDRADLR